MSIDARLAEEVIQTARALEADGYSPGTSGNVSVRTTRGMLITPSGVEPAAIEPDLLVDMNIEGDPDPGSRPSSEWAMHAALYRRRADVHAIVHTHSRFATVLACCGRSIPSYHYMVAAAGSLEIPLAPYETFGTPALSDAVVSTIGGGNACLMANHGQIAVGKNLSSAVKTTELVERLAEGYWGTLLIGGPNILSQDAMGEVVQKFIAGYGSAKKQESEQ